LHTRNTNSALPIPNRYKPEELGKRLAFFGISGVAGNMFLGILQAALYNNLNGVLGKPGWQWLFIVSGTITITWGLVGLVVIPDSPANTRAIYLTLEERELARKRMADCGTTTQEIIKVKTLGKKLKLLVKTPITWLFLLAYLQFAWSQRANSYFLLFLKGLKLSDGTPRYSVYTVNLIPLGGYAISMVCNLGLNALSDWKAWRWQVSIGSALVQLLATAVLSAWPSDWKVIMAFYFLLFSTAAWGYTLVAWLGDILRKEPEVRGVLVALAVCLVYTGHATIPLRAWRVSDSPRYPIGFPLSAAFAVGSIIAILALRYYVNAHPQVQEWGLGEDGEARATEETLVIEGEDDVSQDGSREKEKTVVKT